MSRSVSRKNESFNPEDRIVIYAYTYPSHIFKAEHTGLLKVKVGDTSQGSDEEAETVRAWLRMGQQGHASEAEAKIIIGAWAPKRKYVYRDHVLHDVFKSEGRRPKSEFTGQGREWFNFEYEGGLDAVKETIGKTIASFGASSKPIVRLREVQSEQIDKAIAQLDKFAGKSEIRLVASLPPRFGKTIWALSLFKRLQARGYEYMVLPAYWLSAHSSFQDEISQFEDYENLAFISDNYEFEIKRAKKEGKFPVIAMSLCGNNEKLEKFAAIRKLPNGKMFVFVDEGDFGAHTRSSREKLDYILGSNATPGCFIMNASGTNISRMTAGQPFTDGILVSTYSTLEANEPGIVKRRWFQMVMPGADEIMSTASEDGAFSWNRVWANPSKNSKMLRAMFRGLMNMDDFENNEEWSFLSLADASILGRQPQCIMVFTMADNAQLEDTCQIARDALPTYEIFKLNGEETSNRKAQAAVKTRINELKMSKSNKQGLVIIANSMGSRSFSVPEIEAAVLAYDKGSIDATIQKVARCLTPGKLWNGEAKQFGAIVTLSVDANRTNDIAKVQLVHEACLKAKETGKPFSDCYKSVLRNLNLFRIDKNGNWVRIEESEMTYDKDNFTAFKEVLASSYDASKVVSNIELFGEMARTKGWNSKVDALLKTGKTSETIGQTPEKEKKECKKNELKLLEQIAQELAMTIAEMPIIISFRSNAVSFRDALRELDGRARERFIASYRISPENVIATLDAGCFNEDLLNITYEFACESNK